MAGQDHGQRGGPGDENGPAAHLGTSQASDVEVLAGVHRFDAVFHDHDAVMLLIDPETEEIVDANPSAASFYGYSVDDMRSMSITDINVMPADEVAGLLAKAASRAHGHFVAPHRLASGEIRRVDVHSSPIRDGTPLLFSIITDIEDRVLAEEALENSERRYRLLAENSTDMVSLINPDGVFLWVSPSVRLVLGYEPDDLVGTKGTDLVHPDDLAVVPQVRTRTTGGETGVRFELRSRMASGEYRWMGGVVSAAVVDERGTIGRIATQRDIQDEVLARKALAAAQESLRTVLDTSRDTTIRIGLDGRIKYVNKRVVEISGIPFEQWIGKTFEEMGYPVQLAQSWDAQRQRVFATGEPVTFEFEIDNADGHRWYETSVAPEFGPDGAVAHVIETSRDITDRKEAQQALVASEELLRVVLDTSNDLTIRVGSEGRIEYVNGRVIAVSGIQFDDWIGRTFIEMGYPADLATSWEAHDRRAFETGEPVAYEFEIDNAEGHRWYETSVAPEFGPDGAVAHVILTSRDITERKAAEEALRASQSQLEQAQRIAHVGSWTLDLATNQVTLSQEMYLMRGLDPESPVPDYAESDRFFTPESLLRMNTAISQTQTTGSPYELELEMVRPDGTHGWMLARGEAVRNPAGGITGVQGVALDITERKNASDVLQALATRDPLTGLANRAALLDEITRAVSARQRSGRPAAVLMMDLDRFKNVNDTLGHTAGDDLLVAAAARIEHVVRAGDLVARLGGDEFVIVMRDLDDPTEAVRAAGRLVDAFRAPFTLAGAELYSTASIGVAIAGDVAAAPDPGDLLREADTAMYAAKDAGRDRVAVFNEDLRISAATRRVVETDLRHALERDQLAVWYQPEIDLATGAVIAVEALLRWHHPDGTVWTADRFIDVAEDTGLILVIGDWALNQASAQGAAWATARPDRPITVRVNTSALQLAETGLLPAIDDALAASGLDPALLCIEITETALLRQTATARNNLAGLHARGIGIALDDFGTGYASLTYLHQYPIDVIKIDRSFINDTTLPDHDHRLVAGIIALATILDITVTAEGVEHPEQATHLRDMGCPSAQGYLYSLALPPDQITPLLDHTYPCH